MFCGKHFIFRRDREAFCRFRRFIALICVSAASFAIVACGGGSVFPSQGKDIGGVDGSDGGGGSDGGDGSDGGGGSDGGDGSDGGGGAVCASPLYAGCEKGSGTAEDPYRIYNIYHLQAMGGGLPNGVFPALALLFPATEESLRAGVATLFGEAEARTAAHYRLENDIDATQTGQTNWHEGQGFLPIGDSASPFLGALNGAGYAVRGLQMRRAGEIAGFFGVVGASGRISNLGVDGGEVEGDSMVGLLAARVEAGGVIEGAWGRGRVRGSDNVGGLVGYLADGATMKRSWFGGHVRGRRNVGGLVGGAEARSESADTIADSWAMAQTRAFVGVGGLAGNWESGNRMTASWSGGPLTGTSARDRFGCLASGSGESSASYSSVETSGCSAAGVGGMAVDSLQTLVAPEWNGAVWDFGGDSDFPALRNIATSDGRGRSLQAGGMIFGLTRLLRGDGTVFPSLPLDLTTSVSGEEQSMLRLDVNGLAADDGSATARLSSCRISGGAISAASNYNGARVSMLLLSSFGARLSLEDEDLCVVGIDSGAGGLATLRLSYAGAGSESADVLHLDYAVQLSPGLSPPSPPNPPISPSPFGFADTPTGFYPVMVFSGATARESVLTVTVMNGSLVSFADGGFASGGGSEAALSLTESAVDLFTIDGLELSLTLEARSGEGQSATMTVSFVSSARGFDGSGLSALFTATELAAGMEVFAATEAGLTIWHNRDEERYELLGTNAKLFTVGADGAVSVKNALLALSGEILRYELRLALRGGGTVSERSLVLELRPPPPGLDDEEVEVPALSESGYALLTVRPTNGGTVQGFANVNGFASAGGSPATISLAISAATALFTADRLALSLTLTASSAGGTVSSAVRIVSSARGFDGADLVTLFAATALDAGLEVFAATAASLTIWHNTDEERYELLGANAGLFTVGLDGAVSVKNALPGEILRYELRLALRGGGTVSERSLVLELRPPPGLDDEEVEVPALSESGYALLTVTPTNGGTVRGFANVNGFASGGGSSATISLALSAVELFTLDGLTLSLTLTASSAGGTVSSTVRIVSSARGFDGAGLRRAFSSDLEPGDEVFGASEAGLTIWHSANEDESYALEGADAGLFGVSGAGAVSALESLSSASGESYELTLVLRGGGAEARRDLMVELTPSLSDGGDDLSGVAGTTVTVRSDAVAGENVWALSLSGGSSLSSFEEKGLRSEGGSLALVALTSMAVELFTLDGLALSLTLTLTAESGEEKTGTVTFVSSAREFNGAGLSTLIVTTALAAGTEVFVSSAAGLTIWHSPNESESYTLEGASAGLFVVGADGGVSARGEIRPTELVRYELTLALSDGEVTARRGLAVELTPPLLEADGDLSELSGLRVTVAATAKAKDFVWGVTPAAGGSFASFANVNGFASAGGAAAALSLSSAATVLFNADGLALSLTLTLTGTGEEKTGTVTFVSSAREFNGAGLSTLIVTTALAAGTEVFVSSAAGLTIWHSPNESESYTLEGANAGLFVVGADGGVSARGEIRPTELVRYELTLALSDGEVTARRGLAVELTPPLLEADGDLSELSGLRVTVAATAKAKDFVWGVTPAAGGSFASFANVNGFASAGGAAAALSLSSAATVLFNADGLALSLTLTLTGTGEEKTGTVTFVSSAREFNGAGLSTLIVTTALAAGTEVFVSSAAGLTIWHSPNESESYTLEGANAGLFVVGADGGVSARGEIRPTELVRYELTLALSDGEVTARRGLAVELTPPLLEADGDLSELSGLRVTVAATAKAKDFVWGVTPAAGGSFASFANVNGFASAGGAAAALSLSSAATVLFNADGLALSLTLTLTAESGEEKTGTVTFVSSAREFNGAGLSTLIVTTALAAGTEVFVSSAAGLTIWHSPNESESYTLEGASAGLFVVGADGGVSARGEIRPTELVRYELTLALSDGEVTARRGLAVELTPPLLEADGDLSELSGLRVTVAATAKAKDFVWGVTPAAGGSFASFANVNGFASAGGAAAALSLSSAATVLFNADGLALSLTLTLTAESGEEKTGTVTFVSSAREFNGAGLSTLIVTTALAAGTEVFVSSAAGLTIWHSPNESESYTLEGASAGLFVVGADGGVSARGEIRPTELVRYELTLALSDGEVTARRGLAVELTPPLLEADGDLSELSGLRVTVAATAKAKDFVWGVTPAAGGSFASFANVNGFASAGGAAAALSLSSAATVLFNADGLALSLTLTLTGTGEEKTGTVTFVSSAREFNGAGLSTLIVTTALAAGTEVFVSSAAGLTIWHSPNESESYTLEGANAILFGASAAGAVSVTGEIRPTELTRYELTLALSDGGVTARRALAVELTPPLLEADEDLTQLRGLTVTVEARAEAGDFVWGVAPAAGGMFAPFANVNGFASAGGSAAALSLATDATVLFDMDGLALSLTLTLTAESGEETTVTVTFVSSAREFNGTGLSTLIVTTALAMGTEVFGSSDAGLTIWHSPNENETYTLEGANAILFGASAAGAVSVTGEIRPTELTRYELTLALSDGGVTARRALAVELTPPLLEADEDLTQLRGLTVTVEARAEAGDFVWGVMPAGGMFASFANVNGFASAGGAAAALSLATDAMALFDMDGLALSLTLTLTAESGEETTGTVTFVSSAREFNGTELSTRIVTVALAAGTEVFGSSDAGLTIWHSPNENETYTLEGANANLFTVGAAGAVSVSVEIRPTELVRYELTLALTDGGVTARRGLTVELTPPLLEADEDLTQLRGLTVTVEARAEAGDFVWGVMPAGGSFASFADVNGFASAGGAAAALSLATDAMALFNADGLALSLTLTLTAESGEETTVTVTFVSSAREFNGTGLSTLIVTTALAMGTEVFGSSDAGLTIWHSPNENETYTLEGANAILFGASAAGAVSVTGEIRPTELTRYELTLALSDGGVTARRALAVELTPPLLEADEDLTQLSGLTVTVAARAKAKDFVWAVAAAAGGSFASFANVNGFASAGGSAAALSLATAATALFDMDELALSLTLTLTAESGEETTGTVTFVSSALEFNGTGLSTRIVTAALAAGTEVFAATDAGLTIWHSPNENETYTLEGADANLFGASAAGAVSARDEIRPTELTRYELTLALTDGGVTARRGLTVELTPPLLEVSGDLSELNGLRVTVEARATVGDFVWGVAPPAGGMFASFANVNGFASAGGSAAALSLATAATELFNADGLALSLTLTLTAETGEEATGTVTFVSSAREFNGTGLSTLIVTAALAAGTEVFAAAESGLTIWHSPNENETYTLEGANANLFDASAAGAVSVTGEIRPTELTRYELTLALTDGGVTARRGLTVELTPPLLEVSGDLSELNGLRVTVEARATVGDFVWGVAPPGGSFASFANVNGFASAGGSAAALSLATAATELFNADGLALSLTLTLTAETGEEATGTVTFVSSALEFNGTGLSTLIVTAALAAGTEVFAAAESGLTIWHSPNENETYTLEGANANLFDASAAGAVSVTGEIRPTELTRYELTLALTDGGVTARRGLTVELTPPLLEVSGDLSELNGLRVTVEARATVGDFVWGVAPPGGSFASFANVNGFASAGGAAAALSLATAATALFDMDELALSLTLTLTAESGEETTGTVTFVSSAREFNGTGLSTRIVTTALAMGTEVFAAAESGLTIWHSPNENETYTLEGANANLFDASAAGAVSARDEIRPTELTRYELTLALSDGGVTARRGLAVELTPPLLNADGDLTELSGLRVTVEARATVGDFVWGVAPAAGGMFASFANVNGFASAGGAAAALSLATDATVLFNADGLALSLTLTLTAESGEETTGTVTFVSSAREFNGTGLSTRIVTAALAAGTEVFGSSDAGLTIWHSPNESESYTLEGANANLFTVGAAGAVSVKGEIRPTELTRYELTLALSDGGVTARRGLAVELTPPLLNADGDLTELSGLRVTVEARATVGDFVWGVAPAAGGMFASFANVNGFASAGGSAAALSLATDATALFDMDELALSLTLTLTAESGEETTGTVTFVSSAREFNGTGLSTRIVTTALAMGTEVFGSSDAGLTIWHSPNENETYTLEGANANLFDASAAGAVSARDEIRPTELTRYELTLALSDGGVTARRGLAVELTPPLLNADGDLTELSGLRVTVEARATVGDFVWGVAPAAGGMFASFANVNGFASAGGAAAALSLATDATVLFNADGLALSLTLTLTAESGEEATGTVTFVSSAREFNGTGLSTRIVTAALAAGTEVFGSSDAGLTIWHSPNESESYTLEGANANLFTVGAAGAVSVKGEIRLTELTRYELTLALSDGGVTARRGLAVELTPPLLNADGDLTELSGLRVTVEARATVGDFVWGVAPAAGGMFASFANVNGFASAGESAAALSLATDATALFDMDGLALSLTLTLTAESGEEATGTVTFVSSAREFNGTGLSTLIVTAALAAGTEVFAAAESGLTIWHSPNENETYTLEGANAELFTVGAAGAVSVKGEIRPTELTRYELTLALSDGGVTARRALAVELTPPLLEADEDLTQLRGLTVTVAATAKAKDFVWGVMPPGGSFASFANVNGFASAGGAAAALSLATDATALFDMDELALSLTLTLTAESGEEATGTVTFVSSAREFNGTGLSTRIVTAALAAGTEVFAATDAGLTIWHSPNESEFYTLEGANANLFTVGAAGAVSVKGEIRPTELTRYELTLALSDGGVTARRALAVELTPPLLEADEDLTQLRGLTVTVAATAKAKDFVWGVAPAGGSFAPFANVNGFASAGGSAAALSLATDATVLFDMDGLALSLTLTLTAETGEETTGTVTFVSSARGFDGAGLFKSIAASMLPAGMNLFTASESALTIWHSPNESESYTLEGANANLFTVGAAGAISVQTDFSLDADARYTLTLVLRGGEVEARRDLTLELLSPFLEAAEESPVTVAADAAAGLAVFTLSLARQAGVSFDGVEANGLRTEGGNEAEIFLSSLAVDLFTLDRLELSLTLTARDNLRAETATIRFVSAARVISKGRVSLTITQARTGQTILAAGAAEISIWHNNNDGERYTLLQSASDFGVDATTGLVTAAMNMVIDIYDITLQLRDESLTLTASQVLRLIDPERWALLRFLEQIEAGEIAWTDPDWDGDRIENPYDWTPTVYSGVTVNLTLDGADPWPIYNVWQLQAIDGVSVSTNGEINGNFNFFGANDLGARYRLALNIDATPTRGWSGGGFQPIGYMNLNPVADDDEGRFVGNLNGVGYEIHGLSVEVDAGHYAGVFSAIGDSGSVASLYFSDLFVSGGGDDDDYVGGLAGSSSGNVFLVGISGRVVRSGDGPIGGLVGLASNGEIVESWFVGEVRADGISDASGIGGLVGDVGFISAEGNALIKNNWAHARVEEGLDRDDGYSGGLIGTAFSGRFQNGWAGGEVVGDRSAGFIGRLDSDFRDTGSSRGYVDFSTSQATKVIENITNDKSVEAVGVTTMVTVSVSRWSNEAWIFGDVTVSDGAADYPFLRRYEAMRPGAQALALAGYQTRLFRDGADPDDALVSGDVLTLDTNGAASVGPTPTPTCRDDADGVAAETNYNNVTVLLRATEGVAVSLVAGGGCGVSIGYPDNAADFSILEILSTRGVAVTISHSFAPLLIAGTARPLVVAANAEAGAAVATIDVRGATNPSIDSATAEFLRTGGGVSAAVVSLGDVAATAAFLEDNMMLTLTLTATNDEGASATATIRFVSAPRAIESRQPIEIRLPRRETQAGMTILPAGISGLDILHNGAALERYFLSQSGSDFEALALGEVRVRARPGLSPAGLNAGEYRLNLFLTDDSVTARRELRVVVLSLEEEALAAFVADIAADRIDWLGGDIDWDDDGILNPYDWTPTSVLIDGDLIGVNLTLAGADGMAGKPWPIYNVWQLQAIDGMSVSVDNEARSGFTLFGDSQSVRLSAHYRLAVDIDARPTRDWGDKGFAPIGGEHSNQSNTIEAFTGGFDGGGYAVRGLFINRPNRSFVGLFSAIENPRKMIDLGVEEADIRGQADVGILAGSLHSSRMQSDPFRIDVRRIWTTGKVAGTPGRPPNRNSRRVGGLVGNMGGLSATSFIDLRDSWSTADVRASNVVGGLIGNIARSGTVTVSNSWAAGNVAAINSVGGFGGFAAGNSWLTRNWSAGAVVGGNSGGFLGNGSATNVTLSLNYWNADTSGLTISQGSGAVLTLSVALQTLSAAYFANDDSWDVGESGDFPLLTALDRIGRGRRLIWRAL